MCDMFGEACFDKKKPQTNKQTNKQTKKQNKKTNKNETTFQMGYEPRLKR